jgi:hypothetical protein
VLVLVTRRFCTERLFLSNAMLVAKDPEGPPGFQFRDFATCLIKVPLGENGP